MSASNFLKNSKKKNEINKIKNDSVSKSHLPKISVIKTSGHVGKLVPRSK